MFKYAGFILGVPVRYIRWCPSEKQESIYAFKMVTTFVLLEKAQKSALKLSELPWYLQHCLHRQLALTGTS